MSETEQAESVGAMLVRLRWAKTSKAERLRVSRRLHAAKAAKTAAASGTVQAKRKTRKASKS
jgi:hypothetical protein